MAVALATIPIPNGSGILGYSYSIEATVATEEDNFFAAPEALTHRLSVTKHLKASAGRVVQSRVFGGGMGGSHVYWTTYGTSIAGLRNSGLYLCLYGVTWGKNTKNKGNEEGTRRETRPRSTAIKYEESAATRDSWVGTGIADITIAVLASITAGERWELQVMKIFLCGQEWRGGIRQTGRGALRGADHVHPQRVAHVWNWWDGSFRMPHARSGRDGCASARSTAAMGDDTNDVPQEGEEPHLSGDAVMSVHYDEQQRVTRGKHSSHDNKKTMMMLWVKSTCSQMASG
ncbi:hypothetical protein BS47DRAFT_1361575 [Hydnum rufescens UP504]|uniref:Uncharacterized protein n=1 Tax=Hydnum rufescens UP504 TaxID=1448309 RepID=A0A9P6AZ61_9AGAM|nr:hypothetical protein BS47DRAFT_1361575 [Hydnum rufescens UP504]